MSESVQHDEQCLSLHDRWHFRHDEQRSSLHAEGLKEAIRQEVAAIPPAMTRKAMDNFRERLQQCLINNGLHLSDVIFKSV